MSCLQHDKGREEWVCSPGESLQVMGIDGGDIGKT